MSIPWRPQLTLDFEGSASIHHPTLSVPSCPPHPEQKGVSLQLQVTGDYDVVCKALSPQSGRKLQKPASDSWPSAEHTDGPSSANNWSKCLTFYSRAWLPCFGSYISRQFPYLPRWELTSDRNSTKCSHSISNIDSFPIRHQVLKPYFSVQSAEKTAQGL